MSAFDSDADLTSQLAPRPWFDLADPPSVRPSVRPGGQLGDDAAILDRWRRAMVARDDAEVDRLVRVSRSVRARLESTTFDDDALGAQQRCNLNNRSGGYRP